MTILQDALNEIGYRDISSQQNMIGTIIARGLFTDAPQLSKKFEANYNSLIDAFRDRYRFFSEGKPVNQLSYEELMILSSKFLQDQVVDQILKTKLKALKFLLGLTQDYTLKPGGTAQDTNSAFSDKSFTHDVDFTDAQGKLYNFFTQHNCLINEFVSNNQETNIGVFGSAGENLTRRLEGFISFAKNNPGKIKLFYTSNARYLLKLENNFSNEIIKGWFINDLNFALEKLSNKDEVINKIDEVINVILKETEDFTKNDEFDNVPAKILSGINKILEKYNLQNLSLWSGDRYSILSKNSELFQEYKQCEELQNQVKEQQMNLAGSSKMVTRSTPCMPTPFDYIDLQLTKSGLKVSFHPKTSMPTQIGDKNAPNLRLANTFDELQSYQTREINNLIMITDSDNLIQHQGNAILYPTVSKITYVKMPDNNFSNFVQSLSKALYQPLMTCIGKFEKEISK